ncbi:regulator of G-protein signaling 19 isoform X3 [Pseudorca crassidens]|uniref:regulator of G-protein signaling 19 isoform X3 n=1 Tax=Pseudorca crassidens TaxID=82174 RepID=UPI00352F0B9F
MPTPPEAEKQHTGPEEGDQPPSMSSRDAAPPAPPRRNPCCLCWCCCCSCSCVLRAHACRGGQCHRPLCRQERGAAASVAGLPREQAAAPPQLRSLCHAEPRGGAELGAVLRQANAQSSGPQRVPRVPAHRVQRGEHALLAGLRGAQGRGQPARGGREGAAHLRGLCVHLVPQGGEPGLPGAGGRQQEDAGAVGAHV